MNEKIHYIGIDAGGSKSIVSLYSSQGVLVNEYVTGGGSLRLGARAVYQTLFPLILKLSEQCEAPLHQIQLGISMAGTELQQEYQAFQALLQAHAFLNVIILSDAHGACLAAHQGQDGICIITGTGIIAWQCWQQKTARAGGFGFPHDDIGSGAWLGMRALRYTLQTLDQRKQACSLTHSILNYFSNDIETLLQFSNQARAADYAKLAPLVIEASTQHHPRAINLLKQSGKQIEILLDALYKQSHIRLPWALLGGLSEFILPFVSSSYLNYHQVARDVPQKGGWYNRSPLRCESNL